MSGENLNNNQPARAPSWEYLGGDFSGQTNIDSETGEKRTYDWEDIYPKLPEESNEEYQARLAGIKEISEETEYKGSTFGKKEKELEEKLERYTEKLKEDIISGKKDEKLADELLKLRRERIGKEIEDLRQGYKAVGTPEEQEAYQNWLKSRSQGNPSDESAPTKTGEDPSRNIGGVPEPKVAPVPKVEVVPDKNPESAIQEPETNEEQPDKKVYIITKYMHELDDDDRRKLFSGMSKKDKLSLSLSLLETLKEEGLIEELKKQSNNPDVVNAVSPDKKDESSPESNDDGEKEDLIKKPEREEKEEVSDLIKSIEGIIEVYQRKLEALKSGEAGGEAVEEQIEADIEKLKEEIKRLGLSQEEQEDSSNYNHGKSIFQKIEKLKEEIDAGIRKIEELKTETREKNKPIRKEVEEKAQEADDLKRDPGKNDDELKKLEGEIDAGIRKIEELEAKEREKIEAIRKEVEEKAQEVDDLSKEFAGLGLDNNEIMRIELGDIVGDEGIKLITDNQRLDDAKSLRFAEFWNSLNKEAKKKVFEFKSSIPQSFAFREWLDKQEN